MNSGLSTVYSDCNSALRNSAATSSSFKLQHFISSVHTPPKSATAGTALGPLLPPGLGTLTSPAGISHFSRCCLCSHVPVSKSCIIFFFSKMGSCKEAESPVLHTVLPYIYIIWKHVYLYPFTGMPLCIAVYNCTQLILQTHFISYIKPSLTFKPSGPGSPIYPFCPGFP